MKSRLQRIGTVIKKYGFSGLYFICLNKLNALHLLCGTMSIKFPNIRHRVYLRCGTSDFLLFRNIFIQGEYNIHLPFQPATIIDAGANIGLAAIKFANDYPSAKIVCVEPES